MNDAIKDIIPQFSWKPIIEQADALSRKKGFVVGGMGGSHLAADLILTALPNLDLTVHHDFGLPPSAPEDALYVAVSYSGDTAETISFARAALEAKKPLAVVASGGALAGFARQERLPLVMVPGGLQPRNATGYMAMALLALMRDAKDLEAVAKASGETDLEACIRAGEELAAFTESGLPLIYASTRNAALAQYAKIVLNETAKALAAWNVFPELDHNEIESVLNAQNIPHVRVVQLCDPADEEGVVRRRDVFADLVRERGGALRQVVLPGGGWKNMVYAMYVAHVCAEEVAKKRGVNPLEIADIDEFKKRTA